MELTPKLFEAIKRKAHAEQEMRDLTGGHDRAWLDLSPETALALVAEIESLRAELATLRGIKVGDTVIVTQAITENDERYIGQTGKVTDILEGHKIFAYVVQFSDKAYRMDKNQIERI